jgi:trigger factor
MNITVTDQEHCKKQLRLEIPATAVRAETDKIATDLARKVSIPGFRPGRVPTSVIKTRFRKELRDEMLSHLIPHALGDAIREKELRVLGEPKIDEMKFGEDDSIDITLTVEVAPEFELANYKSIPVVKRVYKVRDEDVEKTIERLRQEQAELRPVEDRGAQVGDVVTLNLTGQSASARGTADSGPPEPVEGEKAEPEEMRDEDVKIELGAKGVFKEFTEGLEGARAGDTRSFSVDYPADFKQESLAGRKVDYRAEVTAVHVKELPEADDEFAKEVGEEFNTVDELRARVRAGLEQEASHKTEEELERSVIDQLVDRNRFDVPEVAVERQIDSRLGPLFRQLASQGIDPRRMQLNWDHLRDSQRERATRDVRATFILDQVARTEEIEVSDEEIDQELGRIAAGTGQTLASLKARLTKEDSLDSIREQVRNRKALDLVIASADIRIEEVEGLGRAADDDHEDGQAEG